MYSYLFINYQFKKIDTIDHLNVDKLRGIGVYLTEKIYHLKKFRRWKRMWEAKMKSQKAVVLIPEIYGINQYMKDWSEFFNVQGYDNYCIDLSECGCYYSYSESGKAYEYFINKIGFEKYNEVDVYIRDLRDAYKKIIVFGSSVGATIAWRLTENGSCDGMIGYYGSRIRDYLEVNPVCPCLLVFPEQEESFDVLSVVPKLNEKEKVTTLVLPGTHGFADPYGNDFVFQSEKKALDMVEYFLSEI